MFQKYVVLAFCIYLSRIAFASEADVLASLKYEKIPLEAQLLRGEELINYLKTNQNFFEAAITPQSYNFKRNLMDRRFIKHNRKPIVEDVNDDGDDIPESFDARTHWPNCSSLTHIRDQADCGSCWAVSTASALSDRICIASKGAKQVYVSATDILSCCHSCGDGCDGGYVIDAFKFFAEQGAVTGGDYGAKDCCRPYPFHPCGHHENQTYYGECLGYEDTPKCQRKCQKSYNKSYRRDRMRGKDAYDVPQSVKAIQREIMTHGPVVTGIIVYEDLVYYEKGIYKHTAGAETGGHAVKIIGWGTENGVPYWLIANSMNYDWGENGYFRMIRGINDCEIEQYVVAGHV
uniref:Pept_C1 domain-containing protein n=2 Tax=Haemonchus contortus TaxID=6289 RepID=A0A7I4XUK3_HAECO